MKYGGIKCPSVRQPNLHRRRTARAIVIQLRPRTRSQLGDGRVVYDLLRKLPDASGAVQQANGGTMLQANTGIAIVRHLPVAPVEKKLVAGNDDLGDLRPL